VQQPYEQRCIAYGAGEPVRLDETDGGIGCERALAITNLDKDQSRHETRRRKAFGLDLRILRGLRGHSPTLRDRDQRGRTFRSWGNGYGDFQRARSSSRQSIASI
jgi:hypothetical protein